MRAGSEPASDHKLLQLHFTSGCGNGFGRVNRGLSLVLRFLFLGATRSMSARQFLIHRQAHVAVVGYAFHATSTICQVRLPTRFFQGFPKHYQVLLAGPTHTLVIPALGIATNATNLAQVRHGQTGRYCTIGISRSGAAAGHTLHSPEMMSVNSLAMDLSLYHKHEK